MQVHDPTARGPLDLTRGQRHPSRAALDFALQHHATRHTRTQRRRWRLCERVQVRHHAPSRRPLTFALASQ